MFTRREVIELAITGTTGGVAAGVIVAGIRLHATADNFLNFCGGAIGAGLAVIGARWLDQIKERDKSLKVRIFLKSLLIAIKTGAERLPNCADDDLWANTLSLDQALSTIERAVSSSSIEDHNARILLDTVVYWIPRQQERLREAAGAVYTTQPNFVAARHVIGDVAPRMVKAVDAVLSLDYFKQLPDPLG